MPESSGQEAHTEAPQTVTPPFSVRIAAGHVMVCAGSHAIWHARPTSRTIRRAHRRMDRLNAAWKSERDARGLTTAHRHPFAALAAALNRLTGDDT